MKDDQVNRMKRRDDLQQQPKPKETRTNKQTNNNNHRRSHISMASTTC
jgi:hypothetical protein